MSSRFLRNGGLHVVVGLALLQSGGFTPGTVSLGAGVVVDATGGIDCVRCDAPWLERASPALATGRR